MSNAIQSITSDHISLRNISMDADEVTTLDHRLLQAYANAIVSTDTEKNNVMSKLQDPKVTSDPGALFALQQRTSDYNLKVSLLAALARKAVGAVETVVRA